ncbi:MAG: NAD(P)H-dependent oxidoreductase [Cyclobacteriaceae bacterium]|nr:NAD(P)H-dependent oxidoreductase [Cyclobacteriaceae bacterium]
MRPTILIVIGSASDASSNHHLANFLETVLAADCIIERAPVLKSLPHFDPVASDAHPPASVLHFREQVHRADGVIICTPEYVFSIPSVLKCALEWCVSTTVFSGKRTGIITASAHGEMGHAELKLVLRTLQASLSETSSLLIQGIKGKFNADGTWKDANTRGQVLQFAESFRKWIATPRPAAVI